MRFSHHNNKDDLRDEFLSLLGMMWEESFR